MIRSVLGMVLLLPFVSAAQAPFAFRLVQNDRLTYDGTVDISVEVKFGGKINRLHNKSEQRREYFVVNTDALGEAEIEVLLQKIKVENTEPDATVIRFDSSTPAEPKSAAEKDLQTQLKDMIGKPLNRLRIDRLGNLKSTKSLINSEEKSIEPPFLVTMVDSYPKVGLAWQREFAVTPPPSVGKGEAFKALQKCKILELTDETMTLEVDNAVVDPGLKDDMKAALSRFYQTGVIVLDRKKGRMLSAKLSTDLKIPDYPEKGGYYHYKSTRTEKLVEPQAGAAN